MITMITIPTIPIPPIPAASMSSPFFRRGSEHSQTGFLANLVVIAVAHAERAGALAPAPFGPLLKRAYRHCMQGSPFTMIGPQRGVTAVPA